MKQNNDEFLWKRVTFVPLSKGILYTVLHTNLLLIVNLFGYICLNNNVGFARFWESFESLFLFSF